MIRTDGECCDLVFSTDGQQNGLLGVQREEPRALVFGGANRLGEGSFFGVEIREVDAVRTSADIYGCGKGDCGNGGEECEECFHDGRCFRH